MTIREALAEAKRRWDASRPTTWKGAGRAIYHGAAVRSIVNQEAWLNGIESTARCRVGFMESWPGCMMGFTELGCGETFEEAFADADARAARQGVRA